MKKLKGIPADVPPPLYDGRVINRRSFLGSISALMASGAAVLAFPHAVTCQNPLALADPPENGEWDWWRNLNRTLLTTSDDPFASALVRAAAARRDLWIVYAGGTSPGEPRKISTLGVFTVEGYAGTYAEAFCHKRDSRRTFRVERIASLA